MHTVELLGLATGLGFFAGMRLYATVLTLGLAVRLGWITLQPEYQRLGFVANWWVIGLAGTFFVIEFLADKIPWVDTIWDTIHTFVRPLGAAAVAVTAVGDVSPSAMLLAGLVTGGSALTSHSMKAMTRVAVNHSPEPVSNMALSFAGDLVVPAGVWFATQHPLLVGGAVVIFALLFTMLSVKIIRWIRRRASGRSGKPIPAEA